MQKWHILADLTHLSGLLIVQCQGEHSAVCVQPQQQWAACLSSKLS